MQSLEKIWHSVAKKTGFVADLDTADFFRGGVRELSLDNGERDWHVFQTWPELQEKTKGKWSLFMVDKDWGDNERESTHLDEIASDLSLEDGVAKLREASDELKAATSTRQTFKESSFGAHSLEAAERALNYRARHAGSKPDTLSL